MIEILHQLGYAGTSGSLDSFVTTLVRYGVGALSVVAMCTETPRQNRVSENVCGNRLQRSTSNSPKTIVSDDARGIARDYACIRPRRRP